MAYPAVLCITEDEMSARVLAADFQRDGWQIITTDDAGEAIALLFVSRNVQAVLLDQRHEPTPHWTLARMLKRLRPQVRIFLMASRAVDPLPACIDVYLPASDGLQAMEEALHVVMGSLQPGVPRELGLGGQIQR